MPYAALAPLTAFAAALVTTWWLARSHFSRIALDHPNRRSLHQTPIPRTGGLAVFTGVLIAAAATAPNLPVVVWAGCAVALAISFADDVRGVPVLPRLLVHLLTAGACAAALMAPDHGVLAIAVATLGIAWMMNLFNFMDGSDGLAGGMALIGFAVYGLAAWAAGSMAFALMNFSIAAAAAGFLVFNFHPARIFLGDVGAVPLGFLAAAFGLIGWLQRDWLWWFPLLVFSPFIVDASATLARRLLRHERVWEAHRDHYYQRLVQMGWGHRRTALAEYLLMAGCGMLALAALTQPAPVQAGALVCAGLVYALLIGAISRKWREMQAAGGGPTPIPAFPLRGKEKKLPSSHPLSEKEQQLPPAQGEKLQPPPSQEEKPQRPGEKHQLSPLQGEKPQRPGEKHQLPPLQGEKPQRPGEKHQLPPLQGEGRGGDGSSSASTPSPPSCTREGGK